jgi:hypothetical protein
LDLYELAALVWLPDFIDFAFLQLEGSGASSPAATPIATNRLQKAPLVGVLWIASDNFGDPLLAATGLMSYPEDGVGLGCHGCHGCHVSFPFRCFLHYQYNHDYRDCQHLFEDFFQFLITMSTKSYAGC